jgi:hypothetical protein
LPERRGKLVTLSEDKQPMTVRKEMSDLKQQTITAPKKISRNRPPV